jgi:hypothetical protein
VNRDPHILAEAREMLVDGVVHHLKHTMMQSPLIGLADVHARPHADGPEAFKVLNLAGAVFLIFRDSGVKNGV